MSKVKAKVASSFKLLEGAAQIKTAISSIAKRGKALDKDIHIAAVSCLVHADKHGDITLAQRLVDALPNSARANALREWFITYGKFNYSQEKKQLTYKKDAETQVKVAIATPFWTIKQNEGGDYKPLNLDAAILSLVKRIDKAQEHGEKLDDNKVATLKSLVA